MCCDSDSVIKLTSNQKEAGRSISAPTQQEIEIKWEMPNHYNTTGSFSAHIRVNFLSSRIEYDAFRVDLEELNMGPRDAVTVPKLEQAQKDFQTQREKYEKLRDDLSVKVKLLEGNKVTVLDWSLPCASEVRE